jgi:hypothetical protein
MHGVYSVGGMHGVYSVDGGCGGASKASADEDACAGMRHDSML